MLSEYYQTVQEEATDGEIAVRMFKEAFEKKCGCPDRAYRIIFMDLQMPNMDGK